MKNKRRNLLQFFLTILILICITGCNTEISDPVTEDQSNLGEKITPTKQTVTQSENPDEIPSPIRSNENTNTDPDEIKLEWENSAHANSFVVDDSGKNNSCSQCHAPVDWSPTMEDLPESCFTCKFELSEPPSLIEESNWQSIPCKVCHQIDKKGNVAPEISWLSVPALDEYVAVENVNELCLNCHAPSNLPGHIAIVVAGAHADFSCTDCHNSHTLTTSCSESACHESLQDPEKVIPGHDEDHKNVACEACHDASGLEVGPDVETGIWTTIYHWTVDLEGDSESGSSNFVSHNTVLEAKCDRCHFENNPWMLSVDLEN